MSDLYYLNIDLDRLAIRLGRLIAAQGVDKWLIENGFARHENHWEGEASLVTLLEQSEVLALWPADEPGGDVQVEFPAAAATWLEPDPPYVLTEEKRLRFASMPDYESCTIPSFLCGSPASVISKWRSRARRIVQCGRVDAGLKKVGFVHIDRAEGSIVARRRVGFSRGPNHVVIYPLTEVLSELIADMSKNVDENYIITRQLVLEGLDYFWFCLCFTVTGTLWLPDGAVGFDADREEVRRMVARKVLKWWPHICARADRMRFGSNDGITLNPPMWGGLFHLFGAPGIWQWLKKQDCGTIEDYIRQSVEKC